LLAVSTTKQRIVGATAELFRRQGYMGTGVKQIASDANAPFGSLYHFFPGGKEQLGQEVIKWAGQGYEELVLAVFDASPDVVSGTEAVFSGAAQTLRQTDYADACPIETIALEVASTNEALRVATAEVFTSWIDSVTKRYAAAGIEADTARRLAISVICALEGAFVLSRALRSTEPLDAAGADAAAAVRAAL
jgi:AcrR family transcriptional regulator